MTPKHLCGEPSHIVVPKSWYKINQAQCCHIDKLKKIPFGCDIGLQNARVDIFILAKVSTAAHDNTKDDGVILIKIRISLRSKSGL